MTAKDYELIAKAIRHLDVTALVRAYIADQFADVLQRANPRFNRDHFFRAATDTNHRR